MRYRGALIIADVINYFGLVYPTQVLEEVVRSFNQGQVIYGGIADHLKEGMTELPETCRAFVVREICMERDTMIAEIETLDTDEGRALCISLKANSIALRPVGEGIPVDDIVVDYRINFLLAVNKKLAAPLRK